MTTVFVAGLLVGGLAVSLGIALLLAAVIAEADRRERVAKEQPAGVLDPETGAVWTETQRLDVRA